MKRRWLGLVMLSACGGSPFSAGLLHAAGDAGETEAGADAEAADSRASEAAMDAGGEAGEAEAAAADAADAACPCIDDLSSVGLGDFSVAFDLTTIAGSGPILDQRAECDAIRPFWEIELGVGGATGGAIGKIGYEIADGTSGDSSYGGPVVSDGLLHHVVVRRQAIHTITIIVDGAASPTTTNFGEVMHSLAPLEIKASTACMTTLSAAVSNVCLTACGG